MILKSATQFSPPPRRALTSSQGLYGDHLNGNVSVWLPIYSPHKSPAKSTDGSVTTNTNNTESSTQRRSAVSPPPPLSTGKNWKGQCFHLSKQSRTSLKAACHAEECDGELFLLHIALISRWSPLEITAGCVFLTVRLHHRPSLPVHQQLLAIHPT